jgi:iron-sulfur cluster repair protein YtfE (RIC family)
MVKIELQKAPPIKEGPIEHLFACHRRLEDRLAILERAGGHLESAPGEALTAITNSLRFMDTSGVLHTVDEEQSVFPRLRCHLTQEELAYLDELESQHREADRVYESLKGVVAALTESRTPG